MDCTVDYTVTGPTKEPGKEKIILEGEKERQGDYVFTANYPGEYRFCFDNAVSTFTDKLVDFEISVRHTLEDLLEGVISNHPQLTGRRRASCKPPPEIWRNSRAA